VFASRGASGFPAGEDAFGQADGNQFARVCGARSAALVDHGAFQHVIGQFRQFIVFIWRQPVSIHARRSDLKERGDFVLFAFI
jgi:hypothetical protein